MTRRGDVTFVGVYGKLVVNARSRGGGDSQTLEDDEVAHRRLAVGVHLHDFGRLPQHHVNPEVTHGHFVTGTQDDLTANPPPVHEGPRVAAEVSHAQRVFVFLKDAVV